MGQITVEGIGLPIEIKGDVPDEEETQAILEAVRGATETNAPPVPEPIKPPLGLGEIPLEELAEEGPFGLVPRDVRGAVRRAVNDLPGIFPMLAEMSGATAGAIKGAGIGFALGGPPGALGGGIIGGVGGELISQELGVGPTSETNLALAGAGPVIGSGVGAAARLAGRAGGKIVGALPPARVALGRTAINEGTKALQSLGARLLETGAKPAKQLYVEARKAGVKIVGRELNNTRRALVALKNELLPFADFPQVKGALGVIRRSAKSLSAESDFNTFITVRRNVGIAIRAARNEAGVKLGSAKKLFAAMSKDLDDLAARQPTAEAGKLAKAAAARAKTEFSVRDVEGLVARFTEDVGEGALKINAKGLLKQMRALVDPKSTKFDKNFVDGLGDNLPDIMKSLSKLAGAAKAGSPGGPGSIVIRGITAGGGAAIGSIILGDAGAIVGGLLGAGGPEVLTALLMSKPAIAFLEAAARSGRGQVSRRAWLVVGQILTRGLAGARQETPFNILPETPPETLPAGGGA